jgi:GAF domain-containing protein
MSRGKDAGPKRPARRAAGGRAAGGTTPREEAAGAVIDAAATRVHAARRLVEGGSEILLRSIVDATVALFQAEAASIALYDAAANRLVFLVAAGEQGQGVVGVAIPPDQGVAGYVFSTGQSLALSDVARDPRFGRGVAEQTGYVPRSIVAVPLVDGDRTIGVLEVLDKRDSASFSLRDVELAAVFARQAAVAISASRLERDVRTLLADALSSLDDGAPDAGGGLVRGLRRRKAEAMVGAAVARLGRDDDSRLWALAERIASVRRADPAQLDLVIDLLEVLGRHAERPSRGRAGRSRR